MKKPAFLGEANCTGNFVLFAMCHMRQVLQTWRIAGLILWMAYGSE